MNSLKALFKWETKKELRERMRVLQACYRFQFTDVLALTKDLAEAKATLLNVDIENSRLKRENDRLHKMVIMFAENGGAIK